MANNMKKEKIRLMKKSLFLAMLVIASCTKLAHQPSVINQSPQQKVIRSKNGVVTTAHPMAVLKCWQQEVTPWMLRLRPHLPYQLLNQV